MLLHPSPYRMEVMTFREVRVSLQGGASIILPLAGTEVYGERGAMGASSVCTWALANELSIRQKRLLAPLLPYGCSTPYLSFEGTGALRRNTITNIILDLLRSWLFQGAREILVLNGVIENTPAVAEAIHRMALKHASAKLRAVTWQSMPEVLSFVADRTGGEHGRQEFAVLSVAAHLDPGTVRERAPDGKSPLPASLPSYEAWRKRGRDPEQFRKMYSSGTTSSRAQTYDAEFGRDLFQFVVRILEQETISGALDKAGAPHA